MRKYTLNDISVRHEKDGVVFFERFKAIIDESTRCFERYAVQTHFVELEEPFNDLLEKYIAPLYQEGDLLVIGEKIVSLCANNVVHEDQVKVGFWARFLSRFAGSSKSGRGAREPRKLQLTIDLVGLPRVLLASFCSAVTKLLGMKGVFYKIVGNAIDRMDGFNSPGDNCPAFDYYNPIAVLGVKDAKKVCNEIKETYGILSALVDANDMTIAIVGKCDDFPLSDPQLALVLRDNPAGQDTECTPFILLRECELDIPEEPEETPVPDDHGLHAVEGALSELEGQEGEEDNDQSVSFHDNVS